MAPTKADIKIVTHIDYYLDTSIVLSVLGLDSEENIESITFVGLCTDICVISNVMTVKTFFPEIPLIVDSKGCAGVTESSHNTALDAMRAVQVEII